MLFLKVKAQLNPVNFEFTNYPGTFITGLLAHEVQRVVPHAVVGTKDATEAIGTLTDADGVVTTNVTELKQCLITETWVQTGTHVPSTRVLIKAS